MTVAPYGSWRSPITAALLVERTVSLGGVEAAGGAAWWSEGRPAEAGRQVIVRRPAGREAVDVVPPGFSARTLVHEYGGGAWTVHGDDLYFSNFADQRLYRVRPGGSPGPLTPEPPAPASVRFADGQVTPDGAWLVSVRERHLDGGEVVNDLVAVDTAVDTGPGGGGGAEPVPLAGGHDFYAAPRVSPDGRRLAWLVWDNPRMPWDGTELWVADRTSGPSPALTAHRLVAGGPGESVTQPRWSPDGTLHFVSDRTGWWNLYADDGGTGRPLAARDAEFSGPDWVFGQSSYAFLADGRLVAAWEEGGSSRLGVVDLDGTGIEPLDVPFSIVRTLKAASGAGLVAVVASPRDEPAVVRLDVDSRQVEVLKPSRESTVDAGFISVPEPIQFPTEGGETAHALYYPPASADFDGPEGERPPLIVVSHGGPTASATAALNLGIQFWTSRGLAVVDVDYRGSTGYGRAYRQRLNGAGGSVDVDDCVAAARFLAARGDVDEKRLAIRGGSAGGYTTLCALTFRPGVFAVGASHFGVADAEALAQDTHKFEARYLDGLIGPYPEARDLYRERSPINYADRLSCPLILFQGLEDKVVPPAQAEAMVAALAAKGLPYAYVAFEGEQHGFRKAETIKRVAEAELYFYGRVLGFEPADEIEPVPIENLPD